MPNAMNTRTTKTVLSIGLVVCFALAMLTNKFIFTAVLLALLIAVFVSAARTRAPLQIERLRTSVRIISPDTGDTETREEFQNLQARRWRPVRQIEAFVVSSSAYFQTPTYHDFQPPYQTAKWEWRDHGSTLRRGITVFHPPIGRSAISFIRQRISFNTISFNRRDR